MSEAIRLHGMVEQLYSREMIGQMPHGATYASSVLSAPGVLTPGEGIADGVPLVAALYWPAINSNTGKVIDMVRTAPLQRGENVSDEAALLRRAIRAGTIPEEDPDQIDPMRRLVEQHIPTEQGRQLQGVIASGMARAPFGVVGLHRGASHPEQRVARLWAVTCTAPRIVLAALKIAVDWPNSPR